MSPNKPWHLTAFVIVLGVFVYLTSALWSAIFIVALPQPTDAIVDAYPVEREGGGRYNEQITTEWVPIEFKNTLEELKYHHNVRMRDRNRYWVYGTLAFGAIAGVCAFFVIPRWRKVLPDHESTGAAVAGAFFGVLVALLIPMLLSWILPAPAKWFPAEIREIAETRQRDALSRLEKQAASIDRSERFE